ncbi:hypothetical protein GCM10009578_053180 [Streptomyces rhizosphaericus]|uniref:Uncharacterized protein n=1 Tax=Streptomyces rhizosphaericus TaxID=114699 RepID=A0ABN1QFF1_9ACTN
MRFTGGARAAVGECVPALADRFAGVADADGEARALRQRLGRGDDEFVGALAGDGAGGHAVHGDGADLEAHQVEVEPVQALCGDGLDRGVARQVAGAGRVVVHVHVVLGDVVTGVAVVGVVRVPGAGAARGGGGGQGGEHDAGGHGGGEGGGAAMAGPACGHAAVPSGWGVPGPGPGLGRPGPGGGVSGARRVARPR